MAWTTPITWQSQLVTVAQFNEQIRDNLNALKNPPSARAAIDESANYNTTSLTFTGVDTTEGKFLHTITTHGGDVFVFFAVTLTCDEVQHVHFDVRMDTDTFAGGDDGLLSARINSANEVVCVTGVAYFEAPDAGSHIFRLMWKVTGGGTAQATMYAGAGTSNRDLHPQFIVREIS